MSIFSKVLNLGVKEEENIITNVIDLNDKSLCEAIENRWNESELLWEEVKKITEINRSYYENNPEYLKNLPKKKSKVHSSRIFVNTEAVINALIANPPMVNVIPTRETPESKSLAISLEKFFKQKYIDENIKEELRKGLRNIYFSRIAVLKPVWNISENTFGLVNIDPTKIRIYSGATKEKNAPYIIEEIDCDLRTMVARFPNKKKELMKACGVSKEEDLFIKTQKLTYKEAWIDDYVIYKYKDIILDKEKNPYWDWDGIPMTAEEQIVLETLPGHKEKKEFLDSLKNREINNAVYAHKYNYFNIPRKPYIFATVFAYENKPVGSTDFITQSISLQDDIDETKRNITENARLVNGIIKVDSSVMTQSEAQKLRFETGGLIYGKNIKEGVTRETGQPLPNFVLENLNDSRNQIDDVMASSSAFRGIREGQETRGGRIALIDQSFLRLNEFVQVVDFLNKEIMDWFMQLGKLFFTEPQMVKIIGPNEAREVISITRDDFEDGIEIKVVAGKSLPEDRQFKYEQAQRDIELGILSRADYLEIAGYQNPNQLVKNRVTEEINPTFAAGLGGDELKQIIPEKNPGEAPKITIPYNEMPIDAKIQALEKAGIKADPRIMQAEMLDKREREIENDDANRFKILADSHAIMRGKKDDKDKDDKKKTSMETP